MISLCQPCFNIKTVLAYKGHSGFNGFLAPFFNKYLHRLERWTQTITGAGASVQVFENEYQTEQLTGDITQIRISPIGYIPFPFAAPPAATDPAWTVSDNYFSHTVTGPVDFGTVTIKTEVILTQPYSLAALDADTEALINTVNPDNIPWGTVTPVSYDGFGGVSTDNASFNLEQYGRTVFTPSFSPPQRHFFPPICFANSPLWQYSWDDSIHGGLVPLNYQSVAGYVYVPCGLATAEPGFDVACGYAKWVSYVKLAGKYALRTTYYNGLVLSGLDIRTDCLGGIGSCAAPGTRIGPPPPVPIIGQDAFCMITPGADCP